MNMDFGANKTPVEIIKEVQLEELILEIFILVFINKYKVKCGTSLRFWENKGCINSIDPYGWFQW